MPAAVARPVVSVSMHTSGASAGGWPGRSASRRRSSGQLDRSDGPAHEPAAGDLGHVGAEGRGEPRGEHGAASTGERGARRRLVGTDRRAARPRQRRPQVREPALAGDRRRRARSSSGRHRLADAAGEGREEPQGERLAVDARLEARPGAGGTAGVAGTGEDELGRSRDQLVVTGEQALRRGRRRPASPRTGRSWAPRGGATGPATRARGPAGPPSAAPPRRPGSRDPRRSAPRRARPAASRPRRPRPSASRRSSGARSPAGRSAPSRRSRR